MKHDRSISRRETFKVLLGATAATLATPTAFQIWRATAAPSKQINIGWQKGSSFAVAKARGVLEGPLSDAGVAVKWIEFTAGPQMLEALNVGSIDFGSVGEAPPVFAQAAGANLLYAANEPASPHAERILVPKDSSVRTVAELKGKRVALNKGSNVHFLLVKALERAGLKYSDVEVSFLPPADARAAFESKSIDAWVIWDPYSASAEADLGARTLADGSDTVSNFQFFIAAKDYADKNPEVLSTLIRLLDDNDHWIEGHIKESAAIIAPQIGLIPAVAEVSLARYAYGVAPLTDAVAKRQQEIADTFYDLKLIPKKLDVAAAVWRPGRIGGKS